MDRKSFKLKEEQYTSMDQIIEKEKKRWLHLEVYIFFACLMFMLIAVIYVVL